MKIIPIASESLGVRSMATYVRTKDVRIIIDPSAALCPKRYKLPPHQVELDALKYAKQKIKSYALKSDIVTISHYHFDHYIPDESFYKGKKVLVKNIYHHINKSQQKRGSEFQKQIQETCEVINADDSSYTFGQTQLTCSKAFFHGPKNVRVGYIMMVTIRDKTKTVVHASDVQGPVTQEAANYIINQQPDILIMDGPPTNLLGFRFSKKSLHAASQHLIEIIKKTQCKVILDHHLLRDINYKKKFSEPYERYNDKICSFAEFSNKKNTLFEAYRKKIWDDEQTKNPTV
jgi:predicted metallo-beta-lactamase superfamily hydrolase